MNEEIKNGELDVEELASAKEERRLELQKQFSMDTYKVVRKELFAHLRDPVVTIAMVISLSTQPVSTGSKMWCM